MPHPRPSSLAALAAALLAACSAPQQGDPPPAPDADAIADAGTIADAGEAPDASTPQPPQTTITAGPSGLVASASATFAFTADQPGATFECSLDAAPFAACTSPVALAGLADGAHAFDVRSLDSEGNSDPTPAHAAWTIDTVAPTTSITAAPQPRESSATARIEFTASEDGSTFECSLDGAAFAPCTSPATLQDVPAGAHTFAIRATDPAGNVEQSAQTAAWEVVTDSTVVRVMAANLTSGNRQQYEANGPGIRIFEGLRPDVVLVQEFNYGTNAPDELQQFVGTTFGPEFQYFREAGSSIPNGVVSRYPILASGEWTDTTMNANRDFAWARIDVPGPHDLWAVSVHLMTASSSVRNGEAGMIVNHLKSVVPAGDYVIIGGDFNTDSRTEGCFNTFAQLAPAASPYPVDQRGNGSTNSNRNKPYDNLLASPALQQLQVPLVLGSNTFPSGLVFDSRVYTPLSEVAPVQQTDSAATNMQHMGVLRDFAFPTE